VLYVVAGWAGLSVVTYLVVLPLLRVAQRSDGHRSAPRGLAPAPSSGIPSPQALGYSGIVMQRLAEHARTVVGAERSCIAVGSARGAPGFTAIATSGMDPDVIGRRFSARFEGIEPTVFARVTVAGQTRGVLCVGSSRIGGRPELVDGELLAEVAASIGDALSHHARGELASGDSGAEIRALVLALAEASGSTYRHSLEVAATARAVGERLGLARAELVEVELAALLHDIGKLRLPPRILHKPGPLDADELRLVRRHPEWGAEMVASVPGLEAVAVIVRLHHERPDGLGYPHGLMAERIPRSSAIVGACDAYGAMTQRRDYSEPLDVDAALAELELNAGTQFDPEVVEVLASYVREPVALAA
jgi:putative nucleotidyltransferase with HDIG domain